MLAHDPSAILAGLALMLVAALLAATAVSGLVLLIVGTIRKRQGVWLGGLITLLISAVLLAVCVAAMLFSDAVDLPF